MKKYLGILAVLALVAAPVMANFNPGIIGTTIDFGGNPYKVVAGVTVTSPYSGGSSYLATVNHGQAAIYGVGASFDTFCVENGITFTPGTEYYASIDTVAARGNVSNANSATVALSSKTAWLYTQFMNGNLMGATAANFQNAIWATQGQNYSNSAAVQALVNAAANANGIGNVRVMNLWSINSPVSDVQSQLVMVPVPAALVLVVFGLGLVGWARRRMA